MRRFGMAMQPFKPSTWEAKEGVFLQVSGQPATLLMFQVGQPGLHSMMPCFQQERKFGNVSSFLFY